jgi:cystathionine gamma-synthase/cystathionine gamma-lyase
MRFATKAIRVGQPPDSATGAIVTPIYQTVNFVFDEISKPHLFEYSRSGNPTRSALEHCLASLEEARFGLAFSSGMAAVDAVLSMLGAGDHVVASQNIYGGTFRALEQVWKPRGVSVTYVDATDNGAFARAIGPKTRMVWIETPANPLLQLVDVRAVAALTRPRGITLVDDNTFPSPYFQRPLTQGVDVVVHSTSKYISGHSDVIGGAVATSDEKLYEKIKFHQNAVGAIPGPMDCWLSLRGLKTLAVRMRQHEANAKAVAAFLAKHPKVVETIYPGLPSHPQHELAKAQMDGFGGIVTFRLEGGNVQVAKLVKALKIFYFAESLGGVESLLCHPATMSHAVMSAQEREAVGITDGVIRLSVGIEDVHDLIEDLEQGLNNV